MALQIRNNKIVIYDGSSTAVPAKVKFDTSRPMPTLTFEIGGTYTISSYPNSGAGSGVRSDVLDKILIYEHPSITNWTDSFIFPTYNIYGGMIDNRENTIVGIGTVVVDVWGEDPGWFAGSVILYVEPEAPATPGANGKLYLVLKYAVCSPNNKNTLRNTNAKLLNFDTSSSTIPLINHVRIDYKIYYGRFTAILPNSYVTPTKSLVRALIVGGGGGGGGGALGVAGGGGGGGEVASFSKYYYNDLALDIRIGAGGIGGQARMDANLGENGQHSWFAGVYAYGGAAAAGGDAGGYDGIGYDLATGCGSGGSGYHASNSDIPDLQPAQNTPGVTPLDTRTTTATAPAIAYNNSRYNRKITLGGPKGGHTAPDPYNNQTKDQDITYSSFAGGNGHYDFGGGGGGAGQDGHHAVSTGRQPDQGKAGDGGAGFLSDITGTNVRYAGGGGGGGGRTDLTAGSIGLGGLGGGGNGGERNSAGNNAIVNTGGGGGGKGVSEYGAGALTGWGKVEKTNRTTIVGKLSAFTREVDVGDVIMFNTFVRTVTAVTDTTITVNEAFPIPQVVNWISQAYNTYTLSENTVASNIIFGNWYVIHNLTTSSGHVGGNGGSGVVILRVPSDTIAEFTPEVVYTQTTVGSDKVYIVTETKTDYATVTFRKV